MIAVLKGGGSKIHSILSVSVVSFCSFCSNSTHKLETGFYHNNHGCWPPRRESEWEKCTQVWKFTSNTLHTMCGGGQTALRFRILHTSVNANWFERKKWNMNGTWCCMAVVDIWPPKSRSLGIISNSVHRIIARRRRLSRVGQVSFQTELNSVQVPNCWNFDHLS